MNNKLRFIMDYKPPITISVNGSKIGEIETWESSSLKEKTCVTCLYFFKKVTDNPCNTCLQSSKVCNDCSHKIDHKCLSCSFNFLNWTDKL